MRILLTSDTHGLLHVIERFAERLKNYDTGIIAGDILEGGASDEAVDALNTAGKPVLVIPGNHDPVEWASNKNVMNLHLKRVPIGGIPFVGYGAISTNLGADFQMALLDQVEHLIGESTILVTHFPPYGVLDDDNGHVGSRILAEVVATRKPLFHFFGHAHPSAGVAGNSINASYPFAMAFCGIDTTNAEIWTERSIAVKHNPSVRCPTCGNSLKIPDQGRFLCPTCMTAFEFDATGKLVLA